MFAASTACCSAKTTTEEVWRILPDVAEWRGVELDHDDPQTLQVQQEWEELKGITPTCEPSRGYRGA
jgi:hypothetical protein